MLKEYAKNIHYAKFDRHSRCIPDAYFTFCGLVLDIAMN